jgi:hypothetical protein
MFVGGAMANRPYDQQTVIYQQPNNYDYQARADAEAARRSAEQAALAASQAQQLATAQSGKPNLLLVKVRVPPGIFPGQSFTFTVNNRSYSIRCPDNAVEGQEVLAYIPATPNDIGSTPIVQASDASTVGKTMLRDAFATSNNNEKRSQSPSQQQRAVLIKDHIIDERALENLEHGIVAGKRGDVVTILSGSIEQGLPPPYSEYCLVEFSDGKIGKVSKYLLRSYPDSKPPPALT